MHTRRLDDPEAAFERLLPVLREPAAAHDLDVEPGRAVIEVRAHGMHKGAAVHKLVDELGARAVLFGGDDLGDVEAFKAVEELRGQRPARPAGLLGAREEESALADLADVVVDGPGGVLELLRDAHRATSAPPAPETASETGRLGSRDRCAHSETAS